MAMKNSNDTIGNWTRDLPTCSAVPQPNALPRAPVFMWSTCYFRHILMKLELSRQIFEKYSNVKFHSNPFNRSLLFYTRKEGRTHRRINMTKLIVAIRNFAMRLKNTYYFSSCIYSYLKDSIKFRLLCLMKNCYITLVHCLNKGFLITFGQLYLKQSSATRSFEMSYANALCSFTNDERWTKRIPKPSGRGRKWK